MKLDIQDGGALRERIEALPIHYGMHSHKYLLKDDVLAALSLSSPTEPGPVLDPTRTKHRTCSKCGKQMALRTTPDWYWYCTTCPRSQEYIHRAPTAQASSEIREAGRKAVETWLDLDAGLKFDQAKLFKRVDDALVEAVEQSVLRIENVIVEPTGEATQPLKDYWPKLLKDVLAALATPSPQAPQEPTAEHNRLAASLCGCGMPYMSDCERCERIAAALAKVPRSGEQSSGLGRSKGEPFHLSQNAESAPSSVATQEPAGSGAKQRTKPTVEELEAILNSESSTPVEILSDGSVREIAPFGALTECEHQHPRYSCTICSPRKVGEDGASELKIGDVVLVEATISGISRLEDGQVSSEDLLHLRVGNGHGSIVRRCVRPSSVPVGEQKQEDGV